MLRRLKGWITAVCFLGLSAIALASAVQVLRSGVIEGSVLSHDELREALLDSAMTEQSTFDQLRLARQLEQELLSGVDWRGELSELPRDERRLALDNFTALLDQLLWQKVNTYHALPKHRREPYLDRQLEELLRWQTAIRFGDGSGPKVNVPLESLTRGLAASSRAGNLSDEERQRMRTFAVELQKRWLNRGMQQMQRGAR